MGAACLAPNGQRHPFYRRLNDLLDEHDFDAFVEDQCRGFCAAQQGRPSLAPGVYFRLLLVGYFEGIDLERGIAWQANHSQGLRRFLRVGLEESPPDHSTISRTRRRIDLETHREVFAWVLRVVAESGLLKGQTIAIDATTLEANAALRSIVRRETSLGFDSGSDPILASLNKSFNPEEVKTVAKIFSDAGIFRRGFLLLGGPGETRESVEESLAFADSLHLDALKVTGGVRIYPETPLASTALAEGMIRPDDELLWPRFYLTPD